MCISVFWRSRFWLSAYAAISYKHVCMALVMRLACVVPWLVFAPTMPTHTLTKHHLPLRGLCARSFAHPVSHVLHGVLMVISPAPARLHLHLHSQHRPPCHPHSILARQLRQAKSCYKTRPVRHAAVKQPPMVMLCLSSSLACPRPPPPSNPQRGPDT